MPRGISSERPAMDLKKAEISFRKSSRRPGRDQVKTTLEVLRWAILHHSRCASLMRRRLPRRSSSKSSWARSATHCDLAHACAQRRERLPMAAMCHQSQISTVQPLKSEAPQSTSLTLACDPAHISKKNYTEETMRATKMSRRRLMSGVAGVGAVTILH